MKIITWNVNSIRARISHVLDGIEKYSPDILLLQETKIIDDLFPVDEFEKLGYEVAVYGQKAWNGVAIISKLKLNDIEKGMPKKPEHEEARVISATVDYNGKKMRVVSVYVPQGQDLASDKYTYKLSWLEDFRKYLIDADKKYDMVVAAGDYNIAPRDEDIYDPKKWGEKIAASPPERDALRKIINENYTDAHLMFDQRPNSFSWWNYRHNAFAGNKGLRIDLALLSDKAKENCIGCVPDDIPRGWEKPSDHGPVIVSFK